jgi:hypothetical protein
MANVTPPKKDVMMKDLAKQDTGKKDPQPPEHLPAVAPPVVKPDQPVAHAVDPVRPVVYYRSEPISPAELAVDITIDHPFNGFFGGRIIVPTEKGKDREATLLGLVKNHVTRQVGDAAAHITYRAI